MFFDFSSRTKQPTSNYAASHIAETSWGRDLASKEILFSEGDRRTCFYRVETGAICLYESRWNDERAIIDFAFPGDYVGLGFLEQQSCNARAICDCQVRCIPFDQLAAVIGDDPAAQQKLHEANQREFDYHRANLVQRNEDDSLSRVASFLLALSSTNAMEGRDANVIGDSMGCGAAAGFLALSIDELEALLVQLMDRGLIELTSEKSIRILDIEGLEHLSNRNDAPVAEHTPSADHNHGKRMPAGYLRAA